MFVHLDLLTIKIYQIETRKLFADDCYKFTVNYFQTKQKMNSELHRLI